MAAQPQMDVQGVVLPLRRCNPDRVISEAELRGDITPLHAVCAPADVTPGASTAPSLFGDWLVRRGVIDRAGLFRALQRSSVADGCRIGDALVELGLVERRALELEACMFRDHCDCQHQRGPETQEPPTLREGRLPEPPRGLSTATSRRRPAAWRLLLVAAASSLLTAAGAWMIAALSGPDGPPRPALAAPCVCGGRPAEQRSVPKAAPEPASPTLAVGAGPGTSASSVILRITSTPPGATVIDELGLSRGRTPLKLLSPRGAEPLQLQVTKRGYQRARLNLTPTQDGAHRVVLQRRRGVADSPKRWGQR